MIARIGAALVALSCLAPTFSSAGVIRGTLTVPRGAVTAATANPYPGRANSLAGAHGVMHGLVTDAVVYVDRIPAAAESALAAVRAKPPTLAQKDQAFVPRVVAIAAGSRVEFPNLDPIYHNVFSLSPPRRFDLGKYPKGQSKHVQFPDSGLVNVYCDIHSGMEAFILVLPHHAFARPKASGDFALPDLPAGTYRLMVWHPDFGTHSSTVVVPGEGAVAVDLDF